MHKVTIMTMSLVMAMAVRAADRLYVGSKTSGDISLPANWTDATLPTVGERACVWKDASHSFESPADGLTLGKNLTFGNLYIYNRNGSVRLDLCGHTLAFPSSTQQSSYMLAVENNTQLTLQNGCITNLSRCTLGINTHVLFTNMTAYLQYPYFSCRYGSALTIGRDALLTFTTDQPYGDCKFFAGENDTGNTGLKEFVIDGGRVVARTAVSPATQYRRNVIGGQLNVVWRILNGGHYDDISPTPGVVMTTDGALLQVASGGVFTMTNAVVDVGDYNFNKSIGLSLTGANSVLVSNATLRVSRFNQCSADSAKAVFHDAEIDFRHHGTGTSSDVGASGFYARNGSVGGNFRMTGSAGSLLADNFVFENTSRENAFESEGGNIGLGKLDFAGYSNAFSVRGGSFAADTIRMDGSDTSLLFENCAVSGGVTFVSTAVRATVTYGTGSSGYMPYRSKGLIFADGMAGTRLVVSNAQLVCDGAYYGDFSGNGGDIWEEYARPNTNCPNSAIEFRGTHPRLTVSSSKTDEGGGKWFCAAFGSFDYGKLGNTELKDALALRFVVPPEGWTDAPLQGAAQMSAGGRPLVLSGNARIEVDTSAFDVATRLESGTVRIPLIRDVNNFTQALSAGKPFFMLDIEALNATNKDRLPEGGRLVYRKDGTAGCVDLVFRRGFVIFVK